MVIIVLQIISRKVNMYESLNASYQKEFWEVVFISTIYPYYTIG